MSRYAVGIDLGGTYIKSGVVDPEGCVVARGQVETAADQGKDEVVRRIVQSIQQAPELAGIDPGDVVGVGIGSPGPLDTKKGVIHFAPNLPGWTNLPLAELVEGDLRSALPLASPTAQPPQGGGRGDCGIPIFLENDANAAAYAESWVGAGKGSRAMILLTLGTGIGGGIVLDGEIWHGVADIAGEIGHVVINFDGPVCGCGRQGCLEAYASAPALVRRTEEGLEAGRSSVLRERLANADDEDKARLINDAAEEGDELAREMVQATARYLGIGIINYLNIFNPDTVVLSGGLAKAGPVFWDTLHRTVGTAPFEISREACRVVPAQLGDDTGVIGAAGCAWKRSEIST